MGGFNTMYINELESINPNSIKRTTDSSSELVSVAQAKEHLRVTHSDDDTYIETLITACRQSLEISTHRALGSSQTYQIGYKRFPTTYHRLVIPNPPIVSVSSLKYYDTNNTLQTVSSSDYTFENNGSGVAYLAMNDAYSYPTLSSERVDTVILTCVCGYTALPKPLHQAMLLLIAHYYDTREPVAYGAVPIKVQRTVDFIANQYKVRLV